MKRPDNNNDDIRNSNDEVIKQLIGMGKQSARKSYYPMLQEKINELKKEQLKYKNLFDSIADAIVILSLDGYILDANLEAIMRYEYEPYELFKTPIWEIDLIHDKENVLKIIDSFHSEISNTFETIHLTKSGKKIYTEVTARFITYNNQQAIITVFRDLTSLRLAEEELQASQNQLKSIIKAAPCGIVAIVGRHVTYANKHVCNMLGYAEEEIISNSTRLFHTSDSEYDRVGEIYKDIERTGSAATECQLKCKNGRIIDVLLNASAVDQNKVQSGITVTITDITQLKATERALEKRIFALTRPLENTEIEFDELFDINEIQNIQNMFAKATGVESIITTPDGKDITEPSDQSEYCKLISGCSEPGRTSCNRTFNQLKKADFSGPQLSCCGNCGLLCGAAKITVGDKHIANWVINNVRDEAYDMENIIQLAQKLNIDKDTLLKAYLNIPAMPKEKFSNIANSLEAFASQLSNTAYQNIQQANLLSESKKAETIMKNYNETLQDEVRIRTQELQRNNELLQNEIEERKKTEKELKTAQFQLVQSEKMASIGQLASNIAHEINTPLGAIGSSNTTMRQYFDDIMSALKGYSALVANENGSIQKIIQKIMMPEPAIISTREKRIKLKELTEELQDKVSCDIRYLANFIIDANLLDFTDEIVPLFKEPESETLLIMLERISSIYQGTAIIEQAINQSSRIIFALREYARSSQNTKNNITNIYKTIETALIINNNKIKHGIDLKLDIDDVPEIVCNSGELSQVWTNLIHNAIQAMNDRGKLEISVKEQHENIIVKITDNGCGIEKENLDKIFDPLFTTKPAGMGSGLGLDIVKRIIARHNGSISVESTPCEGSTFTVTLPLRTTQANAI